ncbi:GlcNAc-PI de-N-acetylase [Paenibacillus sp. yr247]|nr:GlcNAc-PI de-N-acetylase [Paenibacillus sp. yr247]
MGEVRCKQLQQAAEILGVNGLKVLDFPDSGLDQMDPRVIEQAIAEYINEIKPAVLVTLPVHGISGHPDHLKTHAVVKRVYFDMKDNGSHFLKRLAFITLSEEIDTKGGPRIFYSQKEQIDCVLPVRPQDLDAMTRALSCYTTSPIPVALVVESVKSSIAFELFGEDFKPVLHDLTHGLNAKS